MADPVRSEPRSHAPGVNSFKPLLLAFVVLAAAAALGAGRTTDAAMRPPLTASQISRFAEDEPRVIRAPELDGGVEWLNCAGPIRLKDLRGKIVLLDFWTYCCINCIHVLPDLAKLEKKYPNELVVIGVHSAKFDTEKDSKNIRAAILRYNIEHPVVNDANHKIWRAYSVRAWPTMYLIDPEGNIYGRGSGEGLYDAIEEAIERLIKEHRKKKTLDERPIRFDLAKFRERKTAPLFFPGKVLADVKGGRLFIADSSHHRIVVTDLGGKCREVIGSGDDGLADGPFDKAAFNDPQGMALAGDVLYVADRKNHCIRTVDLKEKRVTTVAGTGKQGHDRRQHGDPRKVGLNSPWDLYLHDGQLYIAMAGHHQIWKLDLKNNTLAAWAGTGREDIRDGTLATSFFAQPSGLASDGKWLYVADSEVSGVRAVSLDPKEDKVKTLVGEGLFEFGDKDGVGDAARLQHCLGVAWYDGKVLVADTYNHKLKLIDPQTRRCETFLGDGKAGKEDNPPRFDEPSGLSVAGDVAYVADTNNHAIRIVDLKKKTVRTLMLEGVEPPPPPEASARPSFPNAAVAKLAEQSVPKDGDLEVAIQIHLPKGAKLNPLAPIQYLVESAGGFEHAGKVEKPEAAFSFKVPIVKLVKDGAVKISVVYFYCLEGGEGVCQIRSQIWEVPLRFDGMDADRSLQLEAAAENR